VAPLPTAALPKKPLLGVSTVGIGQHPGPAGDKTHGPKRFLLFVAIFLGLLGIDYLLSIWQGPRDKLGLNQSQCMYGLISIEICIALYLFGVGWLSPYWRPYPKNASRKQTAASTEEASIQTK
jgi:hypothetical protein